jgi:hypothetical protein
MKDKILAAAVALAESLPLHAVTRADIAKKAKCAPSLVSYYMGNAGVTRINIVTEAVRAKNVKVIAGAVSMWEIFPGIPSSLKRAALKVIAQ